jgi:hypothetical protein
MELASRQSTRAKTAACHAAKTQASLGPGGVLLDEVLLASFLKNRELLKLSNAAKWLLPYRFQLLKLEIKAWHEHTPRMLSPQMHPLEIRLSYDEAAFQEDFRAYLQVFMSMAQLATVHHEKAQGSGALRTRCLEMERPWGTFPDDWGQEARTAELRGFRALERCLREGAFPALEVLKIHIQCR